MCTARRPMAKTSRCGSRPRRPHKAEIAPIPSPSPNVRRGRGGRRTGRRNGRTGARRRGLPDRDPRKEESRWRARPVRGRRERVRTRVERPPTSGRVGRSARLRSEMHRAERNLVLHHPPSGIRDQSADVRSLARRWRRGRRRRAAHIDQGHRDNASRRRWRVEANGQTIDTHIVIGADGPASFVARQAGLVRSLERIGAYEYRFRREDVPLLDPQFFLLYIGEAYKGGYAWIFPKGDSVNVGAGGHIDAHAATVDFCRKFGIDVDRKTQTVAGSIPSRYDLTALAASGLAIAGDAAGITKPPNRAGNHPGIFSGRIAGEFAVAALEREDPTSMMAYDRAMKASPFLDPLLFWMIERIRRWGDRLMNSVGEELDGLDWRAVNPRMILSVLLRKPWLGIHAREFYRMILALELCDRNGW